MPPRIPPREFALDVVRALRAAGHQALFAGGCVRDELLGLIPKDFDVATSARPEQVQALFPRTISVGASFGVVEVLGRGRLNVQVATFRKDSDYLDGRRPQNVIFCDAEEDAKRRDFTINGMFFDPIDNSLIDYVQGRADLDARILRAIGNPAERFHEDRLRILRGVRLAARFTLRIDPDTALAMSQMAPQLNRGVSAERIAEELRKILIDPHRVRGMRLFMEMGLAAVVMPELVPMVGLPQGLPSETNASLPPPGMPGDAERDLWDHTLEVLAHLAEPPSFPLAMAALLHDIGKPRTVGRTPDRYTFYAHEHVGKRIAGEIAHRLRLSNDERERIEWLVEKHQILADAPRMRPAKLKALFIHPGIEELFHLHRADARASNRDCSHIDHCIELRARWEAAGELAPPPLLTGADLLALDIPQGPIYKQLLDRIREAQLDRSILTRQDAIALLEQLLAPDRPSSDPVTD